MLSVIVPVYNVEKYIAVCVDSVLNQTFEDFELLLINDGSTDFSGNICDSYLAIDKRVRVFHQENRGVSSARNVGIQNAKGDFLCFIDSDDWVDTSYLADFLVDNYQNHGLILMNMDDFSGKQIFNPKKNMNIYEKSEISLLILDFNLLYYGGPYIKLFKRDVLITNKIIFPINLQFGEDTLFFLKYLLYVESVCFVNKKGYHYRDSGVQSLSKKIHNPDEILWFLSQEKKYVIELCSIYNCTNSAFYRNYNYLLFKRLLLNLSNSYVLRLSYYKRKSIWFESKSILRYCSDINRGFKSLLMKVILPILPFFIFDFVLRLFSCKRR